MAATDSSVFLQWSRVVLFRGQMVNDGPKFLKGCQRSRDLGPVTLRSMGCLVGEMKTNEVLRKRNETEHGIPKKSKGTTVTKVWKKPFLRRENPGDTRTSR